MPLARSAKMQRVPENRAERGTILLVVVFIATAIAGLALISSGRVVTETRYQLVMEGESMAFNHAYAQIHLAMNVVNTSAYDDSNHNLALRDAIAGAFGGTAAGETTTTTETTGGGKKKTTTETAPVENTSGTGSWLDDPDGVVHGLVEGTDVRVYRGRDYIKRLQKLRGETVSDIDPFGDSDRYFVLEAAGRCRQVVRLVSALVRETQPFSSYVFFQNQHTLGISGKPLGLIHTNDNLAFYFPNGRYVDAVSAVNGFEYRSGATPANTFLSDANPDAAPISLEEVDFDDLKSKSNLYVGEPGLDAEILFFNKGQVRIKPYTPPRMDTVELERTRDVLVGYTTETSQVWKDVQVGTEQVEKTRQVISHYETETYTVTEPVYETRTETYTVEVPVYEDQQVTKTRQVPVYDTRTVTKTRWVKVFVPYETDDGSGSGTTVGDSGGGVLGEYQWVQEEYETTETYIASYETEEYTVTEAVQVGTTTETRTREVTEQVGTQEVEKTREVPVYTTETYYEEVPIYEKQKVTVETEVPVYETETYTETHVQFVPPVPLGQELLWLSDTNGTIFIDGRIVSMGGDLKGRLTIVSTDKVRITDDIRYIDDDRDTAMLNGSDPSQPYMRNTEYEGNSVLGVIAKDDIVFTWNMSNNAEINATLMSVEGRVGMDGIWLDANGEPYKDSWRTRKKLLSKEEYTLEDLYDRTGTYRTRAYVKESMRRIGGLISNDRIMETYIRTRRDGTAYVSAGFKRGAMRFDFNMLHNPPPNFVEVPRPVLAYFAPVFAVRADDD
jgi:Tfp pilus assembly protein PilX